MNAIDVANLALSYIGATDPITSLSPPDQRVEAELAAKFFPLARSSVMSAKPWAWATYSTPLAQASDNPRPEWKYCYILPSRTLRVVRVFGFEHGVRQPYAIHGNRLFTEIEEAQASLIEDLPDPLALTSFPPDVLLAVAQRLASHLAGGIIRGIEGARVSREYEMMARDSVERAWIQDTSRSEDEATWGSIAPWHARGRLVYADEATLRYTDDFQ